MNGMRPYTVPMRDAKQSTSCVVDGFSHRKKFFSSKLAQMASTQSAPAMSATPMGANAGEDATSPRVKRTIPATRIAAESHSFQLYFFPTMSTENAITGTIFADLNTMRVA
eukprot:31139-Pelagococcus_subviridis.AAC.7